MKERLTIFVLLFSITYSYGQLYRSVEKYDWEARFLSTGKFCTSSISNVSDTMFDTHGVEMDPGMLYTDSCFTYELKNDIIKIASHGHEPEMLYYFKIIPSAHSELSFIVAKESDFK